MDGAEDGIVGEEIVGVHGAETAGTHGEVILGDGAEIAGIAGTHLIAQVTTSTPAQPLLCTITTMAVILEETAMEEALTVDLVAAEA